MFNMNVLALVLLTASYSLAKPCFSSNNMKYGDLEEKMLTDSNIEMLRNTFYPTNSHSRKIVNVSYHFTSANDKVAIYSEEVLDALDKHPGVCFFWSSSAIHLSMNPEMLCGLSLRTYNPEIVRVTLTVDLSGLCSKADILEALDELEDLRNGTNNNKALCDGSIYLLNILNNFTANLNMYALGQKSFYKEAMHPEHRGYSVYYYQPKMSSKYCVIQKEGIYGRQRLLLNFGSFFVFICTIFGFPILFIELYKVVINLMNKKGSKYWMFIIWSIIIVCLFVNILILINDIILLYSVYQSYDRSSLDILAFLTIFFVFIFGAFFINFFSCIGVIKYMHKNEGPSKHFPLPHLLEAIIKCCCNSDHSSEGNKCCPRCVILALGYAILVHFLQLASFHSIYIIHGAEASPAETLSATCDYVTAFSFSIICIAVILKYMNKDFDSNLLNYLACILPLSCAGMFLIAGIVCFTVYFYHFDEIIDTTSPNEGVWGVAKTILPSLIVVFIAFCGHKLLESMRENKNEDSPPDKNISENSSSSKDDDDVHPHEGTISNL